MGFGGKRRKEKYRMEKIEMRVSVFLIITRRDILFNHAKKTEAKK
jgi:hypothetical protein